MIVVLTGDDSFALQAALAERVKQFVSQHGELAVERLDGEEVSAEHIFDAVNSVPLLSTVKMVILRSAASHKTLLERLVDEPAVVPQSTTLILLSDKFDKRASYYKKLKNLAEFFEFSAERDDIAAWLVEYAKKTNGSLSRSDANYLAQRVGSNKTKLANEIDKLTAYEPAITRQNIDLLSEPTPQSTVFQLLDAAFSHNVQRALELYDDQRQQKVEPLAILAMIAWQLHSLAIVKTAPAQDAATIAKRAKLNPFVVRKSVAIASKLTLLQLRRLIRRALELDIKLKTTAIDADAGLRHFLLSLSQA